MFKKTALVLVIVGLAFFGMSWYSKNVKPIVPRPPLILPIPKPKPELGMVECVPCDGTGTIEFKSISIECPRCNGFGKIKHVGDGKHEPYDRDFAHGYKDNKAGVPLEDNPYFLGFRKKDWTEGWEKANNE